MRAPRKCRAVTSSAVVTQWFWPFSCWQISGFTNRSQPFNKWFLQTTLYGLVKELTYHRLMLYEVCEAREAFDSREVRALHIGKTPSTARAGPIHESHKEKSQSCRPFRVLWIEGCHRRCLWMGLNATPVPLQMRDLSVGIPRRPFMGCLRQADPLHVERVQWINSTLPAKWGPLYL